MFAFTTKIDDKGRAIVGGIVVVPADAKSTFRATATHDIYMDVFATRVEAEAAHAQAKNEA